MGDLMNLFKTSILGVGILLGASAASAHVDIIGPTGGTLVGNLAGIAGNCDVGYDVKIFVTDINGTMTPTAIFSCSSSGWYSGNLDLSNMVSGSLKVKAYQFINSVNVAYYVDITKKPATASTPPPVIPPPVVVEKQGYVDIIGPSAGDLVTSSLGIAGNCGAGVSVKVIVTDANSAATPAVNLTCASNGWFSGNVDLSSLASGALTVKTTQLINGSTYAANVGVTKKSSTTTPPPPVTPPPVVPPPVAVEKQGYVDIIGPSAGDSFSNSMGIAGNCGAGVSVKVVVTDANNAVTPAVNLACSNNGWFSGSVDLSSMTGGSLKVKTTQLINGSTYAANVVVNKKSGTTAPPPPPPPANSASYEFPSSPVGTASVGIRTVSTFNNISLYYKPSDGSVSREALVRYRVKGTSAFSQAQSLWFDKRLPAEMGGVTERSQEYRGSIVGLNSGTTYEVEVFLTGVSLVAKATVATMSENFPIAKTVVVNSSNKMLTITEGGSPSGYVLYTAAAGGSTLDVANLELYNINVQASYVIIRGFTLKGAQQQSIHLRSVVSDVVIENNDISGFGRLSADGFAVNGDAGIGSESFGSNDIQRLIVQRNTFHHPRYDANSWDKEPRPDYGGSTHPAGAQSIYINRLTGQFIFRFNTVYSDDTHYFNDCVGGESNFSWTDGFPGNDADIHDNNLSYCWDDGIESEGTNQNVRVYNNFTEKTYIAHAMSSTSIGPLYVFRNTSGGHQYGPNREALSTGYGFKAQGVQAFGGRVYLYHNTMLIPQLAAVSDFGKSLQGMVTRNNIFRSTAGGKTIVDKTNAPDTDVNYDLVDGMMDTLNSSQERNGIFAIPLFDMSMPVTRRGLLPTSPGYDAGVRLPNFNDGYRGVAPDMGATER
jgi:hypothetical protein